MASSHVSPGTWAERTVYRSGKSGRHSEISGDFKYAYGVPEAAFSIEKEKFCTMSGSEEKKLNSLHEEDSLYKAQGGKAAYQISPTYGQNTLYKVNPVHDAWDRALAAESI